MSDPHKHAHHGHQKTGIQKHAKWIILVGVGLMLVAMAMYVFSDNEMLQPGRPAGQSVPAVAP